MAITVTNQWQEGDKETGEIVYDYRQIHGAKGLMNGYEMVRATFGQFEVVGRTVVHSTYNGDGRFGYDDRFSVSEYLDDLRDLKAGNVDWLY
jgi:hypothetical protein